MPSHPYLDDNEAADEIAFAAHVYTHPPGSVRYPPPPWARHDNARAAKLNASSASLTRRLIKRAKQTARQGGP